MELNGRFYSVLREQNRYSEDLKRCIEDTVEELLSIDISANKPGMLLGKIQSGKTRTFLGILGLAFDNNFDVSIVLTKGTKALTEQTYQRLERVFDSFMADDCVQIFNIMTLPDNLTDYELNQKLIIVSKKQTHNLQRLRTALFDTYPQLSQKRVLIVDDEADFASVGFHRTAEEGVEINGIASQIDDIRRGLQRTSFLQVTATPYSLYLQPDNDESNPVYEPKRPAFTKLVPVPDNYIGGDYYFEQSIDATSAASFLFEEVHPNELDVLKRSDRRVFRLEDSLGSDRIRSLRDAIVNFVVGGCIRRIQDRNAGLPLKKFSFIIHTEYSRRAHGWQEQVIRGVADGLVGSISSNRELFEILIRSSYDNLSHSINNLRRALPSFDVVKGEVENALRNDYCC